MTSMAGWRQGLAYPHCKTATLNVFPEIQYIYTTNQILFDCHHPNPSLKPNIRKDGVDVDPIRVNGRRFNLTLTPAAPFSDAGQYDCWWAAAGVSPITWLTKTIHVVLYEPEITCEVLKRNKMAGLEDYMLLTNASGNHVDVEISKGDLLNDYQMRCLLGFGGFEEDGKEVQLQWDEPIWDPADTKNGLMILSGNNEEEGNFKIRTFRHEAQLNSSINYTCRMVAGNAGYFNGEPPKDSIVEKGTT